MKQYSSPIMITITEEKLSQLIAAQACSKYVCDLWVLSCVGPNLIGYDQDIYNCQVQGGYDINKCISATQYST